MALARKDPWIFTLTLSFLYCLKKIAPVSLHWGFHSLLKPKASREINTEHRKHSWVHPPPGRLKLNVDGSHFTIEARLVVSSIFKETEIVIKVFNEVERNDSLLSKHEAKDVVNIENSGSKGVRTRRDQPLQTSSITSA
ncbi:hypothetical protein P8452_77064 [Trifolium repens]|nr:hypothetical protein P8452_77064 [Trifolium repens]